MSKPVSLLVAALLVTLAPAVSAKTIDLGGDKPSASIIVPDDWTPETSDGGVEGISPDQKVYVSAEAIDAQDIRQAGEETRTFLSDRHIKVKPETKVQKEAKVAGLPAFDSTWEATDDSGPALVRVSLVKVSDDRLVVFTCWISDADPKSRAADCEKIADGIKPIK